MAVLGASGAGKSTFLDLLARKSKRGTVNGEILVNGRTVSLTDFRRVVGFVDQEDTLMGTLTVYETVLYSALLRLPRDMSFEAKRLRTLETMHELGILGIRDSRVGESGARGISGGEKRRVSIACELVTSPSILFLDEPTSGLDSYNAFNVIEALVQLARTYKRTVVFTIHQPQSNIVALFDKLILLAQGKVVFSGRADESQAYFQRVGCDCPPGFNIADYLIDLTMQNEKSAATQATVADALEQLENHRGSPNGRSRNGTDPELGVRSSEAATATSAEGSDLDERETEANSSARNGTGLKRFLPSAVSGSASPQGPTLSPELSRLVEAFAASTISQQTRDGIARAKSNASTRGAGGGTDPHDLSLRNYKRASPWDQFKILSGRSFKNLYRDPMLMLSHYVVAVVAAGELLRPHSRRLTRIPLTISPSSQASVRSSSEVSRESTRRSVRVVCPADRASARSEDIPGFQNRMGMIFFALALFGFGCLTTLSTFASERLLFTRERANGYYNPATYFAAKLLFDVIPLRVVPAFLFGAIVYAPVGLVPEIVSFWRFILVLVLFNLTASSVVLLLSIVIKNAGVANLVGSLVMLFKWVYSSSSRISSCRADPCLAQPPLRRSPHQSRQAASVAPLARDFLVLPCSFRGLARERGPVSAAQGSPMCVGQLCLYMRTKLTPSGAFHPPDGVDIEVPAATILSMFGFNAQAFWFPDVTLLVACFAGFVLLSYLCLVIFVREQR